MTGFEKWKQGLTIEWAIETIYNDSCDNCPVYVAVPDCVSDNCKKDIKEYLENEVKEK